MKRVILLYIMLVCACAVWAQQDNGRKDSTDYEFDDTLHTVTITPDHRLPITVNEFWRDAARIGSKKSLIPEFVRDQMMHPFAVKQRKQERHRAKMRKILREYDLLKTDDEVLREALMREGIDPDELLKLKPTK